MDTFETIPPHLLVALFFLGGIAVITLLSVKRSLLFLVSLMLALACTGTYEVYAGHVAKTFIHPIPSQRSTIFAAFGALIYFWILANWRQINISSTPSQMVVLVILAFYGAL